MNNNKRYLIFVPVIVLFLIVACSRLYYLNIIKKDYYLAEINKKTNRIVSGNSAPRGRILDRNGNILVDNVGVKTINYTKIIGVSVAEEIQIAKELAEIIKLDTNISEKSLKDYWLITHEKEAKELITSEEYELLEYRKITNEDIYKLQLARVPLIEIEKYSEKEILTAQIYEIMNKGYNYQKKSIKNKNVTEEEFALISESNIAGITLEQSWDRIYPYGNTLRNIFGNISSETMGLPLEEREYYLEKGYSLNDRVGISYLEKQYEEYLKGEKDLYIVNPDNTISLFEEGKRGNDLVLSIDINLQIKVDNILKQQIEAGKKLFNTEYYNHSYAIISDAITGSIIAISGKQITQDSTNTIFTDITTNIVNSSYTMGSVVKAASMTVGYQNDLIDIGKQITDSCVKLYYIPQKCSWKRLGSIDDITALKYSSNYYQFLIAIGLTGNQYKPNMKLNATKEHFDNYRNTFATYGLGVKTGIDLPNEKTGIIGSTIADDLLLNLAIGQYDTYTPIEIVQYINTLANDGKKVNPSLMLQIIDEKGKVIKKNDTTTKSTVDIKPEYLKRIQEGFKSVMTAGTARSYIASKYNPAGKTGTSESFYDSDGDGTTDKKTITSVFAAYAPADKPKYSIVVISPNISHTDGKTDYMAPVTRAISKEISDFLFENY